MKNIGIYSNPYKDPEGRFSGELACRLANAGLMPIVFPSDLSLIEEKPDVLLVLGGDGTILRVVDYCIKNDIPIIGVNLGELGFLTEFEADNVSVSRMIELLQEGKFVNDERTLLSVFVKGKNFLSLNDLVVQRKSTARSDRQVVKIDVFSNEVLLDGFVSDGLIASTPTGSTAYFLSAGGNVLAPNIKAIAIAPICAHSLRSRPIILPDEEKIDVVLGAGSDATVVCDGKIVAELVPGDKICVKKFRKKLRFLRTDSWNFYQVLNKKLNHWSRG